MLLSFVSCEIMLTSDEAVQSPKNICLVNLTTFLDMNFQARFQSSPY